MKKKHGGENPALRRLMPPLRRINLYCSANYIYLVAFSSEREGPTKFLRVDRAQGTGDKLSLRHESKAAGAETQKWLEKIERIETPEVVTKLYGVLGFQKVMDSWYLYVINKGRKVGQIRGSYVYSLEKYSMLRVCSKTKAGAEELRLRGVMEKNLDLTRDFYFSYGYDLTHTMQANSHMLRSTPPGGTYNAATMFVWNAFLLRPLVKWLSSPSALQQQAVAEDWVLPVVHGFFRQRTVELSTGQILRLTLIARRSRHFAGTRLLKRGVNTQGFVANEVETEQIVSLDPSLGDPWPAYCAVVQVRGSIPLLWSHTNIMAPKPDIFIHETDPASTATRRHFDRLFARYGRRIAILNLVRQMEKKPKESYLATRFAEAVGYLNTIYEKEAEEEEATTTTTTTTKPPPPQASSLSSSTSSGCAVVAEEGSQDDDGLPHHHNHHHHHFLAPLDYISYDFLASMKRSEDGKGTEVFDALLQIADTLLPQIDMFVDLDGSSSSVQPSPPPPSSSSSCSGGGVVMEQVGIVRTNCIDCMDRTNIGQFCFGRVAFDRQLAHLGVKLDQGGDGGGGAVAKVMMEMWADHGDRIANQYGGSGAMHKVDEGASSLGGGQRELILTGGAKNAFVAVQRYYSNNVTDYERQQAMDLFLGVAPAPQKSSSTKAPVTTTTTTTAAPPPSSSSEQQQVGEGEQVLMPVPPPPPPAPSSPATTVVGVRGGGQQKGDTTTTTTVTAIGQKPPAAANTIEEVGGEGEGEGVGGGDGDGDSDLLLLLRRVCTTTTTSSSHAGRFPHDSHYGGKLSSFDKMVAYEFDVPVVRGVAFDYVPRSAAIIAARQQHRLHGGGVRSTASPPPPAPASLTNNSNPAAAVLSTRRRRRRHEKGSLEDLYDRYLSFEVTLRNGSVVMDHHHHHHHRRHHHHHQGGEEEAGGYYGWGSSFEEYVQATRQAMQRCDVALMRREGTGGGGSGRRRSQSYDDFLLMRRRVAVGKGGGSGGKGGGKVMMGMSSFDEMLGKSPPGGQEGEEGGAGSGGGGNSGSGGGSRGEAAVIKPSSGSSSSRSSGRQQGEAAGAATTTTSTTFNNLPAPAPSQTPPPQPPSGAGGDGGWEKGGGLQGVMGGLFRRLTPGSRASVGGGNSSGGGSSANTAKVGEGVTVPASGSGSSVVSSASSSITTVATKMKTTTTAGGGDAMMTAKQAQQLNNPLPPVAVQGKMEEGVEEEVRRKQVEVVVREVVEEGERERAAEVGALKEAVEAVRRQQGVLIRLLQEASSFSSWRHQHHDDRQQPYW